MAKDIGDNLQTVANTLPTDCQIHKEAFPSKEGFLYFESPLPPLMPELEGVHSNIEAISWWYGEAEVAPYEKYSEMAAIVCWSRTNTTTCLLPCLFFAIHDRDTIADVVNLNQYVDPTAMPAKFLIAMFNFLEQQLLERSTQQPPRQQRRQLERTTKRTPEVNVIRLRRKHTANPNANHAPIEWKWQWAVRGHWRKQPYRSKGPDAYNYIYIQPYIKGPEDKPLKGAERVYAVVR